MEGAQPGSSVGSLIDLEPGTLQELVRSFAGRRIQGYELEGVPRPWGASLYVRWESRGVKRALELQLAQGDRPAVAVWATASKARKDRSVKIASLPWPLDPPALEEALTAGADWAELWKVDDFFR